MGFNSGFKGLNNLNDPSRPQCVKTQAVFVQINNRINRQIKTAPECYEMSTGRETEHITADKETCCLFY